MAKTGSATGSALVLELAEEFLDRYRGGERPPLKEYTDRYPEHADEIREVFPALAVLENIALADPVEETGPADPAAAAKARPPAIELLGDFRILREIGRGGMGVVYEAEQISLGRHVALKMLPAQMLRLSKQRRRFEREARAAARLQHPHIVPVFGVGDHEGAPYYAMQFIAGHGLDQVLDELRRLKAGDAGLAPKGARDAVAPSPAAGTAAAVARSLWTGALPLGTGPGSATEAGPPSTATQGVPAPAPDPAAAVAVPAPSPRPAVARGDSPARATSSTPLFGSGSDSGSLSPSSRRSAYWQAVARIGVQVAEALAYAHAQGVLHRDIKPSNLLLDNHGTIWVTDFGLAKLDDQQDLTGSGDVLGTLRYMPPEAFEGRHDARGDVYSLGLTLYELLALRPAFEETDRARLIRQVTADEPPRLRKLNRDVPRDLETVVHKAIDRGPGHRYQTAAELAGDLKLFVEDRPIHARPAGEAEKFFRWCRRNPMPAGLLAALVVVLCAGFVVSTWNWRVAEKERSKASAASVEASLARDKALDAEKTAREAAERAGRSLYFSLIDRARLEHQGANIAEAETILDRCEPSRRGWEWHYLKGLDHGELFPLAGHDGWVEAVAYSPDGKWIATGGGGNPFYSNPGHKVVPGTVIIRDAETGRPVHTLRGHEHLILQLAFLADGRLLASSSIDGTVQLHEAATGRLVRTLVVGKTRNTGVLAPAPDGRRLAIPTAEHTLALWDITTGAISPLLPAQPFGYSDAAFSPDGRWLATTSMVEGAAWARYVRVWDAVTGAEVARPDPQGRHACLAISPDSSTLAAGSMAGYISLWNLADGRPRQVLTGHEGPVFGLAFDFDGSHLASASQDRTVRVWDIASAKAVRVIRGHTASVTKVAFSPDGDQLVTGSKDETARVWDLTFDGDTGAARSAWLNPMGSAEAIAYARGGQELRVFDRTGEIRRAEAGSLGHLGTIESHLEAGGLTPAEPVAFDAEGRRLIAVDRRARREAVCLDLDDGPRRKVLRGHTLAIPFVTLSADGTRAATAAMSGPPDHRDEVFVWDAATGTVLHRREATGERIDRVALDPTGRRLALSAFRIVPKADGTGADAAPYVAVVEVDTGREILRREVSQDRCLALGFSGDGRRLAAAGIERTILIWVLGSEPAAVETRQGPERPMDLAFSPDGRRLAVASRQQVKLLDTETAEEVLTLRGRGQRAPNTNGFNPRVRFSPDGRNLLALCCYGGEALAEWSITPEGPGEPAARLRMARRRAVARHVASAEALARTGGAGRGFALKHLDHAIRAGLESPRGFLLRAEICAGLGLWDRFDDDMARAAALVPGDDAILTRAALMHADRGRFREAGRWYARLSSRPGAFSGDWWRHGQALVLAGDHDRYRRYCEECVRSAEVPDGSAPHDMVIYTTLEPVPALDAEMLVRFARRVYDSVAAGPDPHWRHWAPFALGTAYVRAGDPARAEAFFREAREHAETELNRVHGEAWLAIALWHQGRRREAKAEFDRADRYVRAQLSGGRPDVQHRPPARWGAWDWWYLIIAWREAQGLLLDGAFPADAFAR